MWVGELVASLSILDSVCCNAAHRKFSVLLKKGRCKLGEGGISGIAAMFRKPVLSASSFQCAPKVACQSAFVILCVPFVLAIL